MLPAQDDPLAAGSDGVPVPKRTKHVQPVYPQDALAQGIRGIVILDVVVDAQGRVESTNVIRSIPGLDEAAIAAARQWQYEPVRIDGKPVRVRITVPITFALALPALERQEGVPELRQGVAPTWPSGATGSTLASVEVTLEPDGRIDLARVIEGSAPWSDALVAALKTWRFAAPPEDVVLSFRVEARFVAERGSDGKQVHLKADGLRRTDMLATQGPAETAPVAGAAGRPDAAETGAQAAGRTQPPAPAEAPTPPAANADSATSGPQPGNAGAPPKPGPPTPPTEARPAETPPRSADARATPSGADTTASPPVEVITAPLPPLPPENGVSAIRDVTLEPGVPDLTRGRHPVVPPLARIAGASGTVEVEFSVGAAGTTTVRSVSGPDLLKPAAEQVVASWVFRRTRADRAYLVAVLTFSADKAKALVRPQAAPGPTPSPLPIPPQPPSNPAPPPQL